MVGESTTGGAESATTEQVDTISPEVANERGYAPVNKDEAMLAAAEKGYKPIRESMSDDYEELSADGPKRHDVRDEPTGKFTKRPDGTVVETTEVAANGTAPADDKAAAGGDAFKDWPDEWKGKLTALPPETQKLVAESHTALRDAVMPVLQQAKAFEADAQRYFEAVNPFYEQIKANGDYLERRSAELKMPAADILRATIIQEKTLAYGQLGEKEKLFEAMANYYGLSHMIGGAQPALPNDPFADPVPQQDPRLLRELHDLKQERARIEHERNRYEAQAKEAQSFQGEQEFQSAWSQFASAKGNDGQPLRPFANEVHPIMQSLLASGRARTSDEAYAIASKPLNDRLTAEIKARDESAKRAEQTRLAAVEKAKRAAPVKVSGMSRSGAVQPNIRDSMMADFDRLAAG